MLAGCGGQYRMGRAYSLDLRERVVAAVVAGESCRSVAATFKVSVASVVKWSKRFRATEAPQPGRWVAIVLMFCVPSETGCSSGSPSTGHHVARAACRTGRARDQGQLLRGVALLRARRHPWDGLNETEQPNHSASLGDSHVINSDKVFGTDRSSCSVSAGVESQKTVLASRTACPLERAKGRIANFVVDNLFAAVIDH
jgi:Transposase